jgi:hypothetical protein
MGGSLDAHKNVNTVCGPRYDATLHVRDGKKQIFHDASAGVLVELLSATLGTYRVRVTSTAPQ